jgi:vacuolar-type H+-ATPase subunit E/Vma4
MEFREQYTNIIEMLKRTLQFYADESNYDFNNTSKPLIVLDSGKQANDTLKHIEEMEKSIESFENDYNEYINNVNNPEDEANEIINNIKNINNGNKL